MTWKLPLITLLFQFARPPFAARLWSNTNVFMLMRLVGNPIGTIASLLATLAVCQRRVKVIKDHLGSIHARLRKQNPAGAVELGRTTETLWKAFGLIYISYDEWNVDHDDMKHFLQGSL